MVFSHEYAVCTSRVAAAVREARRGHCLRGVAVARLNLLDELTHHMDSRRVYERLAACLRLRHSRGKHLIYKYVEVGRLHT